MGWLSSLPMEVSPACGKGETPTLNAFTTQDLCLLVADNQNNHQKRFYFNPQVFPPNTEGIDKLLDNLKEVGKQNGVTLVKNGSTKVGNERWWHLCCGCYRPYQRRKEDDRTPSDYRPSFISNNKRAGSRPDGRSGARRGNCRRELEGKCNWSLRLRFDEFGCYMIVTSRTATHHICDRDSLVHNPNERNVGIDELSEDQKMFVKTASLTSTSAANVAIALTQLLIRTRIEPFCVLQLQRLLRIRS